MKLGDRRKEWMGLVGGRGVVVALGRFMGDWFAPGTTVALVFGVWIPGALLVQLFTR